MSFLDSAEEFAGEHDKQVDEGLQWAGKEVNERTGDKYDGEVDEAVAYAQQHTGSGDSYGQQGQNDSYGQHDQNDDYDQQGQNR